MKVQLPIFFLVLFYEKEDCIVTNICTNIEYIHIFFKILFKINILSSSLLPNRIKERDIPLSLVRRYILYSFTFFMINFLLKTFLRDLNVVNLLLTKLMLLTLYLLVYQKNY